MKKILFFILLIAPFPLLAQSDDRPSWSDDLPEKVEAPDMEVLKETRKKIELDLDMSDFAQRPNLSDDKEADSADNASAQAEAKKQAAEAEDRRQEQLRKEAEAREQQRLAEEKARQEQLEKQRAEAARLAAEAEARRQEQLRKEAEAREQQRLAEEKARLEQQRLAEEEKQRQLQAEEAAEAARRRELQAAEEAQRKAAVTQATADTTEPAAAATPAKPTSYTWRFVHKVAPDYPVKAYRERKEGWVDVDVTIDPQGLVQEAKVVKIYRNQRVFAKPAIKAVRQWRFDPPQNHGITQPQKRRYRVEFKLDSEAAIQPARQRTVSAGG